MTRTSVVLALAVSLMLGISTGYAAKGAKKKSLVQGVVAEVTRNDDSKTGTVTVKLVASKGTDATEAKEQKIEITGDTKFEKLEGKKSTAETKPATFADLAKEGRVMITLAADGKKAEKVAIVTKGKKKAS